MATLVKSFFRQVLGMKIGESFSGGLLILNRSHGYYLVQKKEKKNKKPASAFLRYYIDKSRLISEKLIDSSDYKEETTQARRLRIAKSMWDDEIDCVKQQYQNEYNKALSKYYDMKKHENEKEGKVPVQPKRPFMLFYDEIGTEMKSQYSQQAERLKAAGQLYKDLSSDEKNHYEQRYKDAMILFNKNLTEEERVLLDEQKKERARKRQIKLGRQFGFQMMKFKNPTAPPKNSFVLFTMLERNNPDSDIPKDPAKFFQRCSEVWRGMSEEEKNVYKEKYTHLRNVYKETLSKLREERWKSTNSEDEEGKKNKEEKNK